MQQFPYFSAKSSKLNTNLVQLSFFAPFFPGNGAQKEIFQLSARQKAPARRPGRTEYFFRLADQAQGVQGFLVLRAGGDEVDAGGGEAGVPQHVGQLGHVPGAAVKRPGEEVAQVVGEDLGGRHPGRGADRLHLCPDLLSGQGPSAPGEEHLARGDFFAFWRS